VLLLDEPLGALDKRLRQQMQIELRQIQREVGITTVFVTHDQEEALTLSDRIAIFNEGQAVQVGTPAEVYERPRTAFAANFLGDANFFRGRLIGEADGLGQFRLPRGEMIAAPATDGPPGSAAMLAVRPEKFTLTDADAPAGGGLNRLAGTVLQAVYSGSSTTYKIRADGAAADEEDLTVFEQNRAQQAFAPGERVGLVWSPAHTVVVEP